MREGDCEDSTGESMQSHGPLKAVLEFLVLRSELLGAAVCSGWRQLVVRVPWSP
jgi:hypothetical protein